MCGVAYVISDPGGDPRIRSHRTGLSTPTTVRTGFHYAFSNDPACTTLSQIIVTRLGAGSSRFPLRFITCCSGNGGTWSQENCFLCSGKEEGLLCGAMKRVRCNCYHLCHANA